MLNLEEETKKIEAISSFDQRKQLEDLEKEYAEQLRFEVLLDTRESFTELVNIFYLLGRLYIKKAQLKKEPEYYTDAAKYFQYVLSVRNEAKGKDGDSHLKENVGLDKETAEIYAQLDQIHKELIALVTSNRVPTRGVLQESRENKLRLEALRERSKLQLEEIDTYLEIGETEQYSLLEERKKAIEKAKDGIFIDKSRSLYEGITSEMKTFLADLYRSAEYVMGKAPCSYSIIGLGSMALQQITPYSDLEFAILTEKNSDPDQGGDLAIRRYFRNLSHLVHFMVINLSETPIPASKYNISLESFIRVGVNFDLGGKTPLGRIDKDKPYCLIQNVEGMLHYLKNENSESKHRDKVLPWILESTTYVYGDQILVSNYRAQATKYLSIVNSNFLSCYKTRALKRLRESSVEYDYLGITKAGELGGNVDTYRPELAGQENEGRQFNAKQEIYRLVDRLLYDLAFYYNIEPTSIWNAIEELARKGVIAYSVQAKDAQHHLLYAASFATILRLKTYQHYGQQKDRIEVFSGPNTSLQQVLSTFHLPTKIVQEGGSLFRYYYTVQPFHNKLAEFCNLKDPLLTISFFRDEAFYEVSDEVRGNVCLRLLKYEDGLRYLENHLVLIKKKHGELHEKVAKARVNLGSAYGANGNYEKQIEHQEIAVKIFKRILHGQSHPLMAIAMNNLANAHGEMGSITKKIKLLEEVLKIEDYPYVSQTLTNLGSAYSDFGNRSKAITLLKESLDVKEQKYEKDDQEVAVTINQLGSVYRDNGDYVLAIDAHNRALSIFRQKYGENHFQVAATLDYIGSSYSAKGNFREAIHLKNKALNVMRKLYRKDHPQIANILSNLGKVSCLNHEYEEAIRYLEESKDIKEEIYGRNNKNIAIILDDLGWVYEEVSSYKIYHDKVKEYQEKAIGYKEEALKIVEDMYEETPYDFTVILNNLCATYNKLGKYKQILQFESKILTVCAKGEVRQDIAGLLYALGIAKEHIDLADAYQLYVRALEVYRKLGVPQKSKEQELEVAIKRCDELIKTDNVILESFKKSRFSGKNDGELFVKTTNKTSLEQYCKKYLDSASIEDMGENGYSISLSLKLIKIIGERVMKQKNFEESTTGAFSFNREQGSSIITSSSPEEGRANQIANTIDEKHNSREAQNKVEVGPRKIQGFTLCDVPDDGNCFYYAVADQLQRVAPKLLENCSSGTDFHTFIRRQVQGSAFKNYEWAGDDELNSFVQKFKVILAVIYTRTPEGGFSDVRYSSNNDVVHLSISDSIPIDMPIVRIAYTGNHFLSVHLHPQLSNGIVHDIFSIDPEEQLLDRKKETASSITDNTKSSYVASAVLSDAASKPTKEENKDTGENELWNDELLDDFSTKLLTKEEKAHIYERAKKIVSTDLEYTDKDIQFLLPQAKVVTEEKVTDTIIKVLETFVKENLQTKTDKLKERNPAEKAATVKVKNLEDNGIDTHEGDSTQDQENYVFSDENAPKNTIVLFSRQLEQNTSPEEEALQWSSIYLRYTKTDSKQEIWLTYQDPSGERMSSVLYDSIRNIRLQLKSKGITLQIRDIQSEQHGSAINSGALIVDNAQRLQKLYSKLDKPHTSVAKEELTLNSFSPKIFSDLGIQILRLEHQEDLYGKLVSDLVIERNYQKLVEVFLQLGDNYLIRGTLAKNPELIIESVKYYQHVLGISNKVLEEKNLKNNNEGLELQNLLEGKDVEETSVLVGDSYYRDIASALRGKLSGVRDVLIRTIGGDVAQPRNTCFEIAADKLYLEQLRNYSKTLLVKLDYILDELEKIKIISNRGDRVPNTEHLQMKQLCEEAQIESLFLREIQSTIGYINRENQQRLRIVQEELDARVDISRQFIDFTSKTRDEIFINSTRLLYGNITHLMKNFLANLYRDSEKIIGAPPCSYSIIGLGSMALQQITPYSDFEFAILTDNEEYKKSNNNKIKNYFIYLTHLVHFRVINLGETVIPTSRYGVDLSELTKVGVNFDLGGKTPLGRLDKDKPYSLIQTPEKRLCRVC